MTGLTAEAVRYYEDEGILTVKRLDNGFRDFSAENVLRLIYIKRFRNAGIGIAVIKAYATLLDEEGDREKLKKLLHETLDKARLELEQRSQAVGALEQLIADYDTNLTAQQDWFEQHQDF